VISLLFMSIFMFQLTVVFNLITTYSNELTSLEIDQHIYVKPVCQTLTRFVYIKMIKCASTTLTDIFKRFGMQRRLSFMLPPKGRIYVGWPYQIDDSFFRPSKSTSGFDILCDHAVYNRQTLSQLMSPGTVYITSMREPFSQVKSMVNYYNVLNISGVSMSVADRFAEFMYNIEKYEGTYKSANASSLRHCVPDGFSMTRNLMSFNLGFPTGGFRSVDEDLAYDRGLIQQWIAELDLEFSLVIIVEYFYESMVLLRRQMCWSLKDILSNATNAGSYEYREENSSELVKIYRQWSSIDYQLYQHFNDSLWRKIAAQVSTLLSASCTYNVTYKTLQPVSHLISTICSNYTSHHELSVLQPSNYSKYHIFLQILVGVPSATALLQHRIPFLLPLKIARPYIVSSAT